MRVGDGKLSKMLKYYVLFRKGWSVLKWKDFGLWLKMRLTNGFVQAYRLFY